MARRRVEIVRGQDQVTEEERSSDKKQIQEEFERAQNREEVRESKFKERIREFREKRSEKQDRRDTRQEQKLKRLEARAKIIETKAKIRTKRRERAFKDPSKSATGIPRRQRASTSIRRIGKQSQQVSKIRQDTDTITVNGSKIRNGNNFGSGGFGPDGFGSNGNGLRFNPDFNLAGKTKKNKKNGGFNLL